MNKPSKIISCLLAGIISLQTAPVYIHANSIKTTINHDISSSNIVLSDNCSENCTHIITGTTNSIIAWKQHNIKVISGKHNIVLENVNINTPGVEKSAIDINDKADVTIELKGENNLFGYSNHPAIWVEKGANLTLDGDGILNAKAGDTTKGLGASAIGGGYSVISDFGNITINGGTINAQGTKGGSAIGGGYEVGRGEVSGNITINGGYVKAIGGSNGAGIGAGENDDYIGTVTINGGVVFAKGNPVSIGAGDHLGQLNHGHFKTKENGNAVVVTPNGIGATDDIKKASGIFVNLNCDENTAVLKNNNVILNDADALIKVYGNPIIDYNLNINHNTTLKIERNFAENPSPTLEIDKNSIVTNDGIISVGYVSDENKDSSTLILNDIAKNVVGNGKLQVGKYAHVKIPLSKEIISISDLNDKIYNGQEFMPSVDVSISNIWGYSHTFVSGDENDFNVIYQNNINAGQASIAVNSTGKGDLLNGNPVIYTFNINKAEFDLGIIDSISILEKENNLLNKLPKENITISSEITNDMTLLKSGKLSWYCDANMKIPLNNNSLEDKKSGEIVPIFYKYTHDDNNFVNEKTGLVNVTIVKNKVPEIEISSDHIQNGVLEKEYCDEKIKLHTKLNIDGNKIDPKSKVTYQSSDKNIVDIDDNGVVSINGVGQAKITVLVDEYITENIDECYSSATGEISVNITKKTIFVDTQNKQIEKRDYNGKKEISIKANLMQNSIINNDDAVLLSSAILKNPNADDNSLVEISYQLQGKDSDKYTLNPQKDYGKTQIYKATPSEDTLLPNNKNVNVYNKIKDNYYVSLHDLVPQDKNINGINISVGDTLSFSIEDIEILDSNYLTKDDISLVSNGDYLKITVKNIESDQQNNIANIKIRIKTTNFKDMISNISLNTINPNEYKIISSSTENGKITPNGTVSVIENTSKTYLIQADKNCTIKSLKVDDQYINQAVGQSEFVYEFKNVNQNHIITANFEKNYTDNEIINHAPIISANDKTFIIGDEFSEEIALKGITAYDFEDKNLTDKIIIIQNDVNINKIGKYNITYKVTDKDNAFTVKKINVFVIEDYKNNDNNIEKEPPLNAGHDNNSVIVQTGDKLSIVLVNIIFLFASLSAIFIVLKIKNR